MTWRTNDVESAVAWRLAIHAELTDHPFIQDPDDIPGGCLTCWENVTKALAEDNT